MLKDLLKKIEEDMGSFSKGQRSIANFILAHYEKAAYMTAACLAENTNVSESTVVRFAVELGFDGYPEFQRALQGLVRTRLTAAQRVELSNYMMREESILESVLNSDADKIRRTLDEIDRESFERAVDSIIGAKHIYIIGVRSSEFLAGFLNYNLRMIFDNVRFVQTASGSEIFEQIINIGENDIMIAISFPRYSKRIIRAVEFAHRKGAGVIALTDSISAPIAEYANELLLARSDMAAFVDTLSAPLSIINAVLTAIVRKKQEEISEKLRELEDIWDKYDVYDKQ